MWPPSPDLDVNCYKWMLTDTCHILIRQWLSRVTFWLDVDSVDNENVLLLSTSNQNMTHDSHRPIKMWHVAIIVQSNCDTWQSTFLCNSQRLNLDLGTTFTGLNIIGGLNASIILKGDQNRNWRQLGGPKMQFCLYYIIKLNSKLLI